MELEREEGRRLLPPAAGEEPALKRQAVARRRRTAGGRLDRRNTRRGRRCPEVVITGARSAARLDAPYTNTSVSKHISETARMMSPTGRAFAQDILGAWIVPAIPGAALPAPGDLFHFSLRWGPDARELARAFVHSEIQRDGSLIVSRTAGVPDLPERVPGGVRDFEDDIDDCWPVGIWHASCAEGAPLAEAVRSVEAYINQEDEDEEDEFIPVLSIGVRPDKEQRELDFADYDLPGMQGLVVRWADWRSTSQRAPLIAYLDDFIALPNMRVLDLHACEVRTRGEILPAAAAPCGIQDMTLSLRSVPHEFFEGLGQELDAEARAVALESVLFSVTSFRHIASSGAFANLARLDIDVAAVTPESLIDLLDTATMFPLLRHFVLRFSRFMRASREGVLFFDSALKTSACPLYTLIHRGHLSDALAARGDKDGELFLLDGCAERVSMMDWAYWESTIAGQLQSGAPCAQLERILCDMLCERFETLFLRMMFLRPDTTICVTPALNP